MLSNGWPIRGLSELALHWYANLTAQLFPGQRREEGGVASPELLLVSFFHIYQVHTLRLRLQGGKGTLGTALITRHLLQNLRQMIQCRVFLEDRDQD